MADAYLLETGTTDRILLEDGSGVLLLDVPTPLVEQDHFRIRRESGSSLTSGVNTPFV